MKITCPKCDAVGNIPEHEIPEAGRFLNCPRCKHGFTIRKPRAAKDEYRVDTCPACHFSTFGEETFGTCPKCGVVVKAFVDRQREEFQQQKNQELLSKKFNRDDDTPLAEEQTAPVANLIENLHPVNLIGWGVALAAAIIIAVGVWGVVGYNGAEIQARLSEQRDEQVSGWYVFLKYGMIHWLILVYGLLTAAGVTLFLKKLHVSLKAMSWLIWSAIAYIPVSYVVRFIYWVMEPVPHTVAGYLIEIFNIAFVSALVGIPLYLLERYLHNRAITTVVRR